MSSVLNAQSVTYTPTAGGAISNVTTAGARFYLAQISQAADAIPPYGTLQRELFLRNIIIQPEYSLLAGAVSIQKTKFAAADWYLDGGTERERQFMQEGLEYRSIGGFTALRARVARDFFTQDHGAFVEVLDMSLPNEKGGKRGPLKEPAVGLAHLDAASCALTRDPVFPVIYYNQTTGARHLLHYTRVIHLVDDPVTDWAYAGWGVCAASRAIQRAKIASKQGILELERMEGLPPGSLLLIRNASWEDIEKQYQLKQEQAGNTVYHDVMVAESIDEDNPVEVEVVRFRSLPEEYDPTASFMLTMMIFALAWGTDIRDFTSVTEGELGSAGEAVVKHAKSRTMGGAYFRRIWQEALNARFMAGTDVRYVLREQDDEQEAIRAETQNVQAETAGKAFEWGGITRDEYRAYLNTIGILTDDQIQETGQETEVTEAEGDDRARLFWRQDMEPTVSGAQDYEITKTVIDDVLAWWLTIPELAPYLPETEKQVADIPSGNGNPESLRMRPAFLRQAPVIPEGAREGLSQIAIDAFKRDARALSLRLTSGEIGLPAWQTEARTLIKRAYVTQAAIGKGGWSNVTRSDWGRVGAMLSSRTGGQYRYLDQFARDIANAEAVGDPMSQARIAARLEMYGDSSRQSLAAADAAYRGILPSQLPALPGDGSTLCLTKCKCHWEYIEISPGIAEAHWELGIADHCESCLWRAENWSPWGVIKVES